MAVSNDQVVTWKAFKTHHFISRILGVLDVPAPHWWLHSERPLGPPESSAGSATSPDAATKIESFSYLS